MKSRLDLSTFYFATLLLLVSLLTSAVSAQQPAAHSNQPGRIDKADEVLSVDTNLVAIPAAVMDRDGRYITDLKKEDFKIFEDGVEQEIAFFAPVEKPFTVLFLLDVSSSMLDYKEELVRSANSLAGQLRPNDQIIVASFFKSVDVLSPATMVSEMQKGINVKVRTDADCPTLLYNAVDDALKRMKKMRGRKAIVLFSDGTGTGFGITAKDNFRVAEEQDALIYTVQFGLYPAEPPRDVSKKYYAKRIEEINGYMRDLAQKAGGRHFQIEHVSDLSKTFGQVADELRRQYSLGYYPKKPVEAGQTRHIAVKVRVPNLAVKARDSYIARKQ